MSQVSIHRSLILVILSAAILTATTLVASAAGAFLWAGMTGLPGGDRASSGLMAAIYAPFALVALLLPVMSAPMARFGLRAGGNASAATALKIPFGLTWLLVFASAEAFTAIARTAAGDGVFTTSLYVHALLAGYAAAASWLLRRPPNHAGDTSADAH
jgi:hypothetical protein